MPDTLVLKLSEDAWNGDAQFTVDMDGVQIAGPTSVEAAHSAGHLEELAYARDFGSGPHTVAIHFINDAWGGTTDTDRNLYVEGITFDGTNYAGQTAANTAFNGGPDADPNAAEMFANGTVTFNGVTGGTETTAFLRGNIVIGSSADDWITVADGDRLTGGAGSDFFITELAPNLPAKHAEITDFQTGRGGDDNQLFTSGLSYPVNGHYTAFNFDDVYTHLTDQAGGTLFSWGNDTIFYDNISRDQFNAANFSYQDDGSPKSPLNGVNTTLTLHVSEDAWNGDAQFRVIVDGHQVSGAETVTASHPAGQVQDFTYDGYFPDSPHTVQVEFVNDAWGGTPNTDRNLYVQSITYNGVTYSGETAANDASNGGPDTDPGAAEMRTNGTVTFNNVGGSSPPPSATSTMTLHVSEDAFQGDAQFVVTVDGTQIGGVQTATALHSQGQVQDITLSGDFGTQGPGTVSINFLNDAWGGTPDTDRNLYVQSIDVNGVHFAGNTATDTAANGHEADDPSAAVMDINGTATFNVNYTAPPEVMG